MMFVVITLTILIGAFLPRFSESYQRLRVERVAFEVAQLLRYAQSIAVTRQSVVHCAVQPADQGRPSSLGITVSNGDAGPQKSVDIPDGITVLLGDKGAAVAVDFFPDGTSQVADNATSHAADIRVADESGNGYQIGVNETTGYVSIQAGHSAH